MAKRTTVAVRPSAYIAAACTVLVWAVALALGTASYAVPAPYTPQNAREQFAIDLLTQLGNTAPTGETIAFVVAWQAAEGTAAQFNPLATSQRMPSSMPFNDDGVQEFASYADGIEAAATTIANGRYPHILAGLQTNDPNAALDDAELGTWGTGAGNVRALWMRSSAPLQASFSGGLDPRRQQIVALALSQLGRPYALGSAGPDTFDCSGLVQWSYAQLGIETTRTTFSQLDALPPVEPSQLLPGDLIYEQFPTDQHVVIYAGDLDGDGTGDAINAGGYFGQMDVNVLYDFFGSHPTFTNAVIGYRRAL